MSDPRSVGDGESHIELATVALDCNAFTATFERNPLEVKSV